MKTALLLFALTEGARATTTSLVGKAAFVGVFAVLLVWLLLLPARFINEDSLPRPWWRNVRFWAVVVTLAQIWVYCYWG